MSKNQRQSNADLARSIKGYLFISLGILSAALGLKGFLLPNGFIDGGVTGISLLVNQLTGLPLSFLILLINAPFFFLAYTQMGRGFALKTMGAIACLALCLVILQFPVLTNDKLLVAVFGGFFLGMGIGLSIRGGSVIDGTEVLALYTSRKSGLTISDVILLINITIFSLAAFLLNLEVALYSILTYLSASKTIDFIINGIEEYTGVTIISDKSDQIRHAIVHGLGMGVTLYKGQRGFGKKGAEGDEIDIVYTVITRLEIAKLRNEIEKIDEQAFVIMNSINDTKGGMIKKRTLH